MILTKKMTCPLLLGGEGGGCRRTYQRDPHGGIPRIRILGLSSKGRGYVCPWRDILQGEKNPLRRKDLITQGVLVQEGWNPDFGRAFRGREASGGNQSEGKEKELTELSPRERD